MAERARQESREAFVLHSYPYRETSLLLDVFARGFGRVSMVARAARSPRSALRGVLLAFQPLTLSWFGKGEVRTLARAEWIGGAPPLPGGGRVCGLYLNELLRGPPPRGGSHHAPVPPPPHTAPPLPSPHPTPPPRPPLVPGLANR